MDFWKDRAFFAANLGKRVRNALISGHGQWTEWQTKGWVRKLTLDAKAEGGAA